MLAARQNVLCPSVDELFKCAHYFNPSAIPLVLGPKRYLPIADIGDATLSDWRPPHVPTGVSQEAFF
jgi:hypothetical protein